MASATLLAADALVYGAKEAIADLEQGDAEARRAARQDTYSERGMSRTVYGVIALHLHAHPHVLLFRTPSNDHRLPGGPLQPGDDDEEGLRALLVHQLGPRHGAMDVTIGQLLATWWRPNFDEMILPYLPAHVSQPKEKIDVYLVHAGEGCALDIPANVMLVAVPLFDLFCEEAKYGQLISSIPHLLSRISFTYAGITAEELDRDDGPAAELEDAAGAPMLDGPAERQAEDDVIDDGVQYF